LTLLDYHAVFIEAVEAMLEDDFNHSRMVALKEYTERPFLFRLAVQSARLLAPIF